MVIRKFDSITQAMESKLKQGNLYPFLITDSMHIADDEYHVIKDSSDNKYLLIKKYYRNYDLKQGDKINCYLDKINCRGKYFFEPEHPILKRGDSYSLAITGRKKATTKKRGEILLFLVKDKDDNIYEAIIPDYSYKNKEGILSNEKRFFMFHLEKIKKAQLFLIPKESLID